MLWLRRTIVCLTTPVLLGAVPSSTPDPDVLRKDVQAFVKAYVEATNKVDASAIMEMVSKDAAVASIAMGQITRGWEAIRNEVDAIVGSEGQLKISVGTIDVTKLGTSFALAFAPCTIRLTTEQGPLHLRGALTLVLEKAAGKWKLLHEHASAQLPTEEAE